MRFQAHTSPIYISFDEKPTAFPEDARYMLGWLDRLVEIAESQPNRFPDSDAQRAVLTSYSLARSRYQRIVNDAQENWGD